MKMKDLGWFSWLKKRSAEKVLEEDVKAAVRRLKGNADYERVIINFIGKRLARAHKAMLTQSATTEVVIEAARNVRLLSKLMDELGLIDTPDERD